MLIVGLITIFVIPLVASLLRPRRASEPSRRSLAILLLASLSLQQIHFVVVENSFGLFGSGIDHPVAPVPITASCGVLIVAADEYSRMDESI